MKNSIIIAITKKASELYQKYTNKGRIFWQDAMRQASKLVKALKECVITFWKLAKGDEEVVTTTRRVTTLESIGYQAKTQKEPNGLIKLVDLDKYEEFLNGVKISYVISFYPFQIL